MLDGAGGTAGDGGGEENEHPEEEEAPPAEAIGEPSGRYERGSEDDVVGVQDPGQLD